MKHLLTLVIVFALSTAGAQIRWQQLTQITDSDPAAPTLKKWQQSIEADSRKHGDIVATFTPWYALPFASLRTLFPQHRFYAVSWSQHPPPGTEKNALGLALGIETTLVCDATGNLVKEVQHTGNYEAFGELLHASHVTLRTADDAKLVWNAFCDIHQKHWQELPAIKVDDKTWHLGDETRDGVHYCYEVLLDSDSRVASAKLRSEQVKKP